MKKDPTTKQKEWIEYCLALHNGAYDYSKTIFTGADSNVVITCKKHNLDFTQRAAGHKRGNRCPQCAKEAHKDELRSRRCLSSPQFIAKVDKIHNGVYDYSETTYISHAHRIVVKCKIHGAFSIQPANHVVGDGCPKCSRSERGKANTRRAADSYPFDVFMSDVRKRNPNHLEKYEYDESSYSVSNEKIRIKCLSCTKRLGADQWFYQLKRAHRAGSGCMSCGQIRTQESAFLGKEEILRRLEKTHPGKFEYFESSDGTWGRSSYVQRKCNDCGDIRFQRIGSALSGSGCGKCSRTDKHTTESFMEISKLTHGPFAFDYRLFEYKDHHTKVTLICTRNNHTFSISPSNHLYRGCPVCSYKTMSSTKEIAWKRSLGIDSDHWNAFELIGNKKFNYDAKVGNTIYEFNGDYWHGNPQVFSPTDLVYTKKPITAKEAYDRTLEKEKILRDHGYQVVSIWEYDWDKMTKCGSSLPAKERFYLKSKTRFDGWSFNIDSSKVGMTFTALHENEKIAIDIINLDDEDNSNRDWDKKRSIVEKNGFSYLVLFEDEWKEHKEICLSIIRNRMHLSKKAHARSMKIVDVTKEQRKEFFDVNHLSGDVPSYYAIGLVDSNDELQAVMSIRKPMQKKKYNNMLEVARFCTKLGLTCNGALSRLSKASLTKAKSLEYTGLMTYVDNRLGTGNSYMNSGWESIDHTQRMFWWTDCISRFDRTTTRALNGKSELEIAKERNVSKIYGCKNSVMIYNP